MLILRITKSNITTYSTRVLIFLRNFKFLVWLGNLLELSFDIFWKQNALFLAHIVVMVFLNIVGHVIDIGKGHLILRPTLIVDFLCHLTKLLSVSFCPSLSIFPGQTLKLCMNNDMKFWKFLRRLIWVWVYAKQPFCYYFNFFPYDISICLHHGCSRIQIHSHLVCKYWKSNCSLKKLVSVIAKSKSGRREAKCLFERFCFSSTLRSEIKLFFYSFYRFTISDLNSMKIMNTIFSSKFSH